MKAARRLRKLQHPRSLIDHVRQFLTPDVWKQARQAVPQRRAASRWDLQPVILIMMAMTWAAGDSQPERFETARGFYVACFRARRRPGKSIQGFQCHWAPQNQPLMGASKPATTLDGFGHVY